jgi:hypothetical protein
MDSDDVELSALDYARHYELCKPYYEEAVHYGTLPVVTCETIEQDLRDLSNESITNSVKALIKERLLVSRDAALLLNLMQKPEEAPAIENLTKDRHRWMLDLKQELPVLRTNAELDLLSFGDTSMPDLRHVNIPFEVIREDSDEGFEWPAKYLTYAAQCDAQIKAEKLVVSRDVLMHLQDAIRDSFTSEDLAEIDNESLRRKSVGEASILQDIAKKYRNPHVDRLPHPYFHYHHRWSLMYHHRLRIVFHFHPTTVTLLSQRSKLWSSKSCEPKLSRINARIAVTQCCSTLRIRLLLLLFSMNGHLRS